MKAKDHVQRMANRPTYTTLASLSLVLLLLGLTSAPLLTLNQTTATLPAEGRQEGLDVDCSGYSFEDLFEYNFALFELNVLDDWATGDLYANAWVNGSNSAIVRDNLDGLFEGLPGGDNGWISTDERDAVRSIGPKCIADMETRLGLREGIPHSGGVDWNDFEFVEDGIGLDEVNLVPESHQDARSCTNFGAASDCKEVPTSTTDDLEISLSVADGQTNNVRWDQLPNSGVSNFTMAMNITNMSNAALVVTFPVLQGLRMYDFRVTNNQPANGESCDIGEPSFTYTPDGALRVTQLVNFDRTQWELECYMFMDFTTQEPESNDAPVWSSGAPTNGTVVPTTGPGTTLFAAADENHGWASDENGWSLDCDFGEATGWSVFTNVLGDLLVTQPEGATQATAVCSAVDPLGAVDANDTRSWTFGTLFTASGLVDEATGQASVTVQPGTLVTEFELTLQAHQNGQLGSTNPVAVVTENMVLSVNLDNLRPGSLTVDASARAVNMLDMNVNLDLGLIKPNSPPVISVAVNFNGENATWGENQLKFQMYGLVSDPDLEAVTMMLTICGAEYQGFNINGINWEVEVSTAICMANGLTNYDVLITATDESGASTQLMVAVPSPLVDDNVPLPEPAEVEEALPAVSFLATLAMLGAVALLRPRKVE